MEAVYSTIEQYFGNYSYPIIFLCCIIAGLIIGKGKRKIFIIPSILIILFALNPILKDMVDKADGGNVYWRALWLIPIIPAIALIPAIIVDRVSIREEKGNIIKIIVVFVIAGVLMFFGVTDKTLYFAEGKNADKLPEDVVSIAEALLDLDEHPRIVSDASISTYLRQYSGKIQSPYGRTVTYGNPSALGEEMYGYLTAGEYSELARDMENYDYQLLVTDNSPDDKKTALDDAGYELIDQVNVYGIYRVHGNRTQRREYNEKGQVITLTYLDEGGNPVNSVSGYAMTRYEYDAAGRVIYEFHFDETGAPAADGSGVAGYQYERNQRGQTTRTTYLGIDGEPVKSGCAYRIYEYGKNKKVVWEACYNNNWELVNVGRSGYAEVKHDYDGDTLLLSYYTNANGREVKCGSSFFHAYLRNLYDMTQQSPEKYVIFISIKDEGTDSLTTVLQQDLYDLGVQTELLGKHRNSYYAILTTDETIEDISLDVIEHSGTIGDHKYTVISGGNNTTGNISSIMIDGTEYSKNVRGMNIVVYDSINACVIESVGIDTFSDEMHVYR